jgi:hypothetical protein
VDVDDLAEVRISTDDIAKELEDASGLLNRGLRPNARSMSGLGFLILHGAGSPP